MSFLRCGASSNNGTIVRDTVATVKTGKGKGDYTINLSNGIKLSDYDLFELRFGRGSVMCTNKELCTDRIVLKIHTNWDNNGTAEDTIWDQSYMPRGEMVYHDCTLTYISDTSVLIHKGTYKKINAGLQTIDGKNYVLAGDINLYGFRKE